MFNLNLDATDLQILDHLQRDASISNVELAERVHLSPSPCARRVKLLEEQGFFLRQVMILNPEKLGLTVHVFIQVTMSHQKKKDLAEFEQTVAQWPEVMECYLMTGDFDYLLRLDLTDLRVYREFLDTKLTQVEGIDSIRSSFSLKQVRYKTEFNLADLTTQLNDG